VAGLAVDGDFLLRVAAEAISHIQIDFALGCRLFGQIAVASGAVYSGADMRGMVEAHMRRLAVVVNAYPGNLFPTSLIRRNLFDFGPVSGDRLVAAHAHFYPGNARLRTLIDAHVAEGARQTLGQVHGMGVGDWLHRMFRMEVEKVFQGRRRSEVRRGENTASHVFRES
jgi:hypothetical protein